MTQLAIPNDVMLGSVSEMLAEGRSVIIRTKGVSMLPFIVGDKDSVELSAKEECVPGDIVLAQIVPGHYVLHRLIAVEGDSVTLMGDGNLHGVERCRKADVCGRVVRILRSSGKQTDCSSERFKKNSRRWRRLPYIVRRVILAIYRRVI